MGNIANIVDFEAIRRPKVLSAAFPEADVGHSDLARLIPGASDTFSAEPAPRSTLGGIAAEFLPRFCWQFEAPMLASTMLDVALIILVFSFETSAFGWRPLGLSPLYVYILAFLMFAMEEDLYANKKTALAENAATCRAVAWAMLFATLSLRWSSARVPQSAVIAPWPGESQYPGGRSTALAKALPHEPSCPKCADRWQRS